jgi:hypothetical protein
MMKAMDFGYFGVCEEIKKEIIEVAIDGNFPMNGCAERLLNHRTNDG